MTKGRMKIVNGIQFFTEQWRSAIHQKLHRKLGKPTRCTDPNCWGTSKIYCWCLKRGRHYTEDKKDYKQMCSSCNIRYDNRNKAYKKHKNCFHPAWDAKKYFKEYETK